MKREARRQQKFGKALAKKRGETQKAAMQEFVAEDKLADGGFETGRDLPFRHIEYLDAPRVKFPSNDDSLPPAKPL
ncbi:hypothetical protein QR680_010096 [Steinernema hermaphroditum]|uniref:Uncharacterized protein n=1 Tax=Steinernema hermaphroditum TaxID=289476 RepID=A0AA39IQ59_9BILA|nr:hypothetical protein QR680_010096 [Steinernema hermaphroditum]